MVLSNVDSEGFEATDAGLLDGVGFDGIITV